MPSFNRTILAGHLTRDPELRYTPSGTAVADVGLAVNDKRKVDGELVEDVTFVDITCWAKTAETVAEYLKKGSPALFEGRLKLDTWETDGRKRSKLKVVADKLVFLGGGKESSSASSQTESNANPNKFHPVGGGPGEPDTPF